MKTIYKALINVSDKPTPVLMPLDARIIHIGDQGDPSQVSLWFEFDKLSAVADYRRFVIHGTGHDIPLSESYIGTSISYNGQLVWHVYEVFGGPSDMKTWTS